MADPIRIVRIIRTPNPADTVMANQLSVKLVAIRKRRVCFACQRPFEKGHKMFFGTYRSEDGIYSIHHCETCDLLMNEFEYGYDDNENAFLAGCVREGFSNGQTPEMLLIELRHKKTEP